MALPLDLHSARLYGLVAKSECVFAALDHVAVYGQPTPRPCHDDQERIGAISRHCSGISSPCVYLCVVLFKWRPSQSIEIVTDLPPNHDGEDHSGDSSHGLTAWPRAGIFRSSPV